MEVWVEKAFEAREGARGKVQRGATWGTTGSNAQMECRLGGFVGCRRI